MSANLYMQPVVEGEPLPYELKKVMEGSKLINGEVVFTIDDYDYLEGLSDAGVAGANELSEAISKHGKVRVWLEY